MKRTLLIVGGGIEAIPGINRAREMGLSVVVSDYNPDAPGLRVADYKLIASTYDIDRTVTAAKIFVETVKPIDGVICIATDVPATVAHVADSLSLPGIPKKSAEIAADKILMKQHFERDGIPIPRYSKVTNPEELSRKAASFHYPVVIKPVDSRGARGVLLLQDVTQLAGAFEYAKSYSPTGRVMIEAFLDGPQVSTEALVVDGEAYTVGFSDRNYEFLKRFAPHIVENGGDLPSHLSNDMQNETKSLMKDLARSMGISDGVIKGDIVIHEGIPHVIEVAARLSGGYLCSHEIPLNTGVDFVGFAIRQAMGERIKVCELTPKFNKAVSQRYFFPDPGRIVRIENAEEIANRQGIELFELRVRVGDRIGPIDNHPARAGLVIAVGETPTIARERAILAVKDLIIETEPET